VRDADGEIFTPLAAGKGRWSKEALAADMRELNGVHSRVIGFAPLARSRSSPREDPVEAAKDNADSAVLSRLESERPA
jgi:hypothetical protein